MRFAIKTSPQHTEWQDILAVWKAADQMDIWESAWLFDHFYPIFSDSTGPCLEGWSALAALAQATERIRVGVLVTGNVYRHPAVLANMAATVDIVSGGRLELGLGAGWNEEECGAYGIDLPPLRERFDRFDEALEAVTGLLSDTTTDFAGKHYQLTGARCEPKPVQRPHPPICIGGTGERRTLRSVARFAQHWNHPGGSPDDIAQKLDVLRSHCADVGRDPSEILVSTHVRLDPAADAAAIAEQVSALEAAGVQLGIITLMPPHTPDVLAPLAEALEPLRS
jgi:F420-dependent oxidoreductase-like protein